MPPIPAEAGASTDLVFRGAETALIPDLKRSRANFFMPFIHCLYPTRAVAQRLIFSSILCKIESGGAPMDQCP